MLFPSVTQVLSPFADFSMIPADVLERSCLRGTAVHDACATIARGLPVMNLAPETTGYVDSYKSFFNQMVDEVILCEERLVDERLLFHGQCDLVIKSKTEGIILVDLKTPVQLQKSWKLQLSAYNHLVEITGIKIDKSGSLQLNKEGKTARMTYYKNSAQDFNLFLQCLSLHRFFNTK